MSPFQFLDPSDTLTPPGPVFVDILDIPAPPPSAQPPMDPVDAFEFRDPDLDGDGRLNTIQGPGIQGPGGPLPGSAEPGLFMEPDEPTEGFNPPATLNSIGITAPIFVSNFRQDLESCRLCGGPFDFLIFDDLLVV